MALKEEGDVKGGMIREGKRERPPVMTDEARKVFSKSDKTIEKV